MADNPPEKQAGAPSNAPQNPAPAEKKEEGASTAAAPGDQPPPAAPPPDAAVPNSSHWQFSRILHANNLRIAEDYKLYNHDRSGKDHKPGAQGFSIQNTTDLQLFPFKPFLGDKGDKKIGTTSTGLNITGHSDGHKLGPLDINFNGAAGLGVEGRLMKDEPQTVRPGMGASGQMHVGIPVPSVNLYAPKAGSDGKLGFIGAVTFLGHIDTRIYAQVNNQGMQVVGAREKAPLLQIDPFGKLSFSARQEQGPRGYLDPLPGNRNSIGFAYDLTPETMKAAKSLGHTIVHAPVVSPVVSGVETAGKAIGGTAKKIFGRGE